MGFKQTFEVVNGNQWVNGRGVEVTSVTITNGTLKSNGIMSYTISPEVEKHDFMRKSGFTRYLYEGNNFTEVKLHGNGTATLYEGYYEVVTIAITDEQIAIWKEWSGDFLAFTEEEQVEEVKEVSEATAEKTLYLVKTIDKSQLWVEVDSRTGIYVFSIKHESFKDLVKIVGAYKTKEELLIRINNAIKVYTRNGVFNPFNL